MGLRLPTPAVAAVVALCVAGAASVLLPWAVLDLLGAVVPVPGHKDWTGRVSAGAFAVVAAVWLGHAARPRLPRAVPLGLAVVVGVGVLALALGPTLLGRQATVSLAGLPPSPVPEWFGAGKWVAVGTAGGLVGVAGRTWWRGRGPAGLSPQRPR